ncbi:MAG: hypothetical protein NTW33_12490 [Methanoregula sp.]|nr:hypothetical protein [Methanoregula sp.]
MDHGSYRSDCDVMFEIITDNLPGFGNDIAKVLQDETRREKESKKTLHPAPEQKEHALTFIISTAELDKEFNYG